MWLVGLIICKLFEIYIETTKIKTNTYMSRYLTIIIYLGNRFLYNLFVFNSLILNM
jgi:hypothetical protein